MDKNSLLEALSGTLDSNRQLRKSSEQSLNVYEQQSGFTNYLLDLIIDDNIQLGIKIAAAIFFKNRIINYWVISDDTKSSTSYFILEDEKAAIKDNLIKTLMKTYKIKQIKFSLATALNNILSHDKWDEMIPLIYKLITSQEKDKIFTGLICLYEYVKNYRWDGIESITNPVMEDITKSLFPLVEQLAQNLVESNNDQTNDEMLYLIVKIFKNATFSSLPTYFLDVNKLGLWCQLHILIINKELPKEILEEEIIEQRNLHFRIKTVKWCFANLNRLLNRHGGGYLTKDHSEFTSNFLTNFVPEILNAYWKIIEKWSAQKIWLSESSLYYMISFLDNVIETPCWPLVNDKLDAIIRHLILPSLQANDASVELYEDDPLEYIRRYFDVNREQKTSDVASINFIHRLANKKFDETINLIFNIINEIFAQRMNDQSNTSIAMQTEGALRVLSTISSELDKDTSPVRGQIDKVLDTYLGPELKNSSKTPWLTARTCDAIAMFHSHTYKDTKVLQNIFQGVISCFQNEAQFPIQLTAADALATLIQEDLVAQHVAEQAPQLMENLLEKSKKYESDILTNVMDTFVERFAKNLEPYAVELGAKLSEQFLRLCNEILEQSSNGHVDTDKEYQANGLLSTLTTLVISMSNASKVGESLERVLQEVIVFVLENAMVMFLPDIVEIMESLLYLRQQVSDVMWSIFQSVIDAFDTYAYEYFDSFQPFFTAIINKGFSNPQISMSHSYVQSLLKICFGVLKQTDMEPIFAHSAFEDIELTILAMNSRFIEYLPKVLAEIFEIYKSLDEQDLFDGYMLHRLSLLRILYASIYIDPITSLSFISSQDFIIEYYKLWIKYSDDFQSVYGCKLQLLCAISIIGSNAIKNIPEDLVGETVDLLIGNLVALPGAIKAKNAILLNETSQKQVRNEENEDINQAVEDEYELDEAEMEALKETPIDKINGFEEFVKVFLSIQQNDQQKYQVLFSDLDDNRKEIIQELIRVTQQSK
ncbi:uncharacterized protein KGF55_001765 [Candida pseudojiufengensis]|uniref:uncharacterized protein n=1 Tax=Candida pseudojiufengensis TaxID=497109 RepID=UPI0022253823|nr:uncharacterized protein KGF55_001765 [Candida pseudojiufengensis]KAI5964696.1 hypothetical protein KGF55_001765 [Candida pseudojiufengensis]